MSKKRNQKEPGNLKAAQRLIREQRIIIESLLVAINKRYDGPAEEKERVSRLTMELQRHIAEDYPVPDLSKLSISPETPLIEVLERIAAASLEIRLLQPGSDPSGTGTTDDTAPDALPRLLGTKGMKDGEDTVRRPQVMRDFPLRGTGRFSAPGHAVTFSRRNLQCSEALERLVTK
ncbi:hypothetical protein [Sutterella sp.]|uniref:hypothetical protein n=1 Tax=Sutterella sp. TaxID=1981025 RepID=UPI0026DF9E57|nr:hypothetical protein [Sutterella sp.]MDO5531149.1 hypothetical protein [Sutterella sp.]